MDLHEQVTRTLNHAKEELERAEIPQPQESLKARRESLREAKLRIQEAKELTIELLEHHIINFDKGIVVCENWQQIADLEDSIASQQRERGGAA